MVTASSYKNKPIEKGIAIMGEVGLTGEVRRINMIEKRLKEAEKLGFKRILIPYNNLKGFDDKKLNIEIVPVRKVEEAFRQLFG